MKRGIASKPARWWENLGGFQIGIFLLASICTTAPAADFTFYSIGKGIYYDQTAGGAPVMKSPYPFLFNAQVMPVGYQVAIVALGLPTGAAWSLSRQFFQSGEPFKLWVRKMDQTALDTAFPNTNYTFDIRLWTGGRYLVPTTLAAGSFPNAPAISNLVAAQSVDATQDFTLTWEPFAAGTAADFIYCQLQAAGSNVFTTSSPGTLGALDGTAGSVVVPAGTLLPGRAYLGRLVFLITQATFTDPPSGANGAAFLFSQTDFWLKTQGTNDNTPPAIAWTTPTNGATGVPSNMPLGFYFTKPMRRGVSISEMGSGSGTGGSFANFSPDGLELVLTAVHGYTSNAVHTFVFNPFEFLPSFGDVNGNPLAADTFALSFTDGATYLTPRTPRLLNPQRQTSGAFQVDLQGEPNYPYVLEHSPDFITWSPLATNIAFNGTARFLVTNPAPAGLQDFYRAVAR